MKLSEKAREMAEQSWHDASKIRVNLANDCLIEGLRIEESWQMICEESDLSTEKEVE